MAKQPGSSSVADISPDDIESMSVLSGPRLPLSTVRLPQTGVILTNYQEGSEGRAKLTYSNTTQSPHCMDDSQVPENIYRGNNEGEFTSWGKRLDTPTS